MKREKGFVGLSKLARKIDNCLAWGKYCNQECCRFVAFILPKNVQPGLIKNGMTIRLKLKGDINQWYLELHGVFLEDGNYITLYLDDFTIVDGYLRLKRKCCLLTDDGKCENHPDKKPDICKALGTKRPDDKDNFVITSKCLYRFKPMIQKEGKKDGSTK